jgi:catechol 2,3-dioxygenase-like lactoylglutathione lyase family enzyme
MPFDVASVRGIATPASLPFRIRKIGHVVLRASDLKRSVEFYTQVLGFRISDVYPEEMMPGGMVFMRCNEDHHGLALVGGMAGASRGSELHHLAFAVETLDEVFRARNLLRERKVPITFEGRRRAGVQIAVEFTDPDGHQLEIYWGLDQLGDSDQARPESEWRGAHTLEEALANPPPGQEPLLLDQSLLRSAEAGGGGRNA